MNLVAKPSQENLHFADNNADRDSLDICGRSSADYYPMRNLPATEPFDSLKAVVP